jgi:hypothetical protein
LIFTHKSREAQKKEKISRKAANDAKVGKEERRRGKKKKERKEEKLLENSAAQFQRDLNKKQNQ